MVNNEFITNNHIPARLDLSDLIYKSKVNEKLVDEILSLGFSRHEIQRALCLMNNNLNKSIELLLNTGGKVSDNSEFELFGGVKYYTTGMNNGHYIYVRDNVVIDDKDIRKVKINEKFYKHFLVLVYKSAADVD
ncbi:ubiquitin thiolesterase, ubiquitinyl hydrolase 1 [Trachipleistophora hominis]|uniref:Ubiquitin thiolesterase, ubiquitinyl hydrolase 1 n=1 Tax=Trachipleistophora hominis TaxID=72359 RepID=L7JZA7_TRAHO|nr:ubiquitin thiolesterase, ubiquitinyl hydrolase 1 [Trachipleistophora hominis]